MLHVCVGVYRLWQPESELGTMATANLTTLSSFGEPFMDAVSKNACSGHDVARVSARTLDFCTVTIPRFSQLVGFFTTLLNTYTF